MTMGPLDGIFGNAGARGLGVWGIRTMLALGALASLAVAAPAAAELPLLERPYLTGDWNGIRPACFAHGFQPYLIYTGLL